MARPPEAALQWVRDVCGQGSVITSVKHLPGGEGHPIHAVTVRSRIGNEKTMVLRRWTRPGWELGDHDFTAAREALALRTVAGASVGTPELIAVDESGRHCDVPALLMSLVPGMPPERHPADMRSFLAQLATAISGIHKLEKEDIFPPYLPYNDLSDPRPPRNTARPGLWTRAFEIVGGTPPAVTRPCLIHRDYHYRNTLWSDGRLTGLIDWGYASFGSASVDVAHMRWNLAVGYGISSSHEFLDAYLEVRSTEFVHEPYWDLRTVVDLVPRPFESSMSSLEIERLEAYMEDCLTKI